MIDQEIYIKKIRLMNCRNIKEAEINFGVKEPGEGQLIELVGDNKQGKTTIRDMVLKIWEGGKDPGLVRTGADVAEGLIQMSDGHLFTRTHSRSESTLTIIGPDGVKVPGGPVAYLKQFGTWFSRDPVAFDDADAKERVKILLEISEVYFETGEIRRAAGAEVAKMVPVSDDTYNLQTFGKYADLIVERRGLIGSQRKEKTESVEALRKSLPADDNDEVKKDWVQEARGLEERAAAIDSKATSSIDSIRQTVSEKRKAIGLSIREAEDGLKAEFNALMGFARAAMKEQILETLHAPFLDLADKYTRLTLLDEAEAETIQAIKDQAAADRASLSDARAAAQTGKDQQIRAGAVLESIATFQAAAVKLNAQWDALQAAVKALETLRKSKVDGALLPGMEVRDDVYMEGVKWPDINTAERLYYSIALCSRGTGDKWGGFLVIDGGERFGPKRKKDIRDAVIASGMQAIMCTVASQEWIEKNGPDIQSVPAGALKVKK